jgi:hypothetical protein
MIGPFFCEKFGKNNVFESWLTGGLMALQQAPLHTINYEVGYYGANSWTSQTIPGDGAVGEGFEVGVKLKFPVIKKIFVTFYIAYDQLYSQGYSVVNVSPPIPMGILNGGIGIEFRP